MVAWHLQSMNRIKKTKFYEILVNCRKMRKFQYRQEQIEQVVSRELDFVKFLTRQRRISYAILSLLNESQRFMVRNLSTRLIKERRLDDEYMQMPSDSSESDSNGRKFDHVSASVRVRRVLLGKTQIDQRLKQLQKVHCLVDQNATQLLSIEDRAAAGGELVTFTENNVPVEIEDSRNALVQVKQENTKHTSSAGRARKVIFKSKKDATNDRPSELHVNKRTGSPLSIFLFLECLVSAQDSKPNR